MNVKIFNTTLYSLLFLLAFVLCEYNDSPLDKDIIGKNTGAVLSTVAVEGGIINKLNPSESSLKTTVLFNDFDNNYTLESADIYLLFADTTPSK